MQVDTYAIPAEGQLDSQWGCQEANTETHESALFKVLDEGEEYLEGGIEES